MKIVTRTFSLPDELDDFVEKKMLRIAKESGEPANLSKYIRDLIRRDKEEEKAKKAA